MGSRIREDVKQLFICFCEVPSPQEGGEESHVVNIFPDTYQNEDTLKSICSFTYPCEFEHTAIQHYSFVLTDEDSKWTFGFCRYDPKINAALVFLTSFPWHDTFYRVLNQVSDISHQSTDPEEKKKFLEALYISDIPLNGSLSISYSNDKTFICRCPDALELPSIPENRNITEYFNAADPLNMMAIFASLLHERRVIFVSRRLPRLSACVQAAASLLYPMCWQHVYIPLLPLHLADYLLAPMPFLVGAPSPVFKSINANDLADVVIFDADTNTLQCPFNDVQNLPTEVVYSLKRDLRYQSVLGDGVSRAFLKVLVMLIGGYRDALRFHPGQCITFHSELFVESRPPAVQPFLKKMLDLQIFQQFVEGRLDMLNGGMGFSDEFEREICQFSSRNSSRFRQQYKDWKRTVRREGTAFFKIVRSKANPAMKSAVKTVREHGREVRAVCRDIRSRMRESQHDGKRMERVDSRALNPKATASYRRRPLHIPRNEGKAWSDTATSVPMSSTVASLPDSNFHQDAMMEREVCKDRNEKEENREEVEGATKVLQLQKEGNDTSTLRSNDAEELLREYGLDFSALSLLNKSSSMSNSN